jgi:hypothetical protein
MTNGNGNGTNKSLNLDELFGTARPIVVVFQGKRYELRRPEAMNPVEFNQWMKLQGRVQLPGANTDEIARNWSEETSREVEALIDDVLTLLNPEFAKLPELNFMMKTQVLEFYTREAFPEQLAAAEKQLSPKNSIGV